MEEHSRIRKANTSPGATACNGLSAKASGRVHQQALHHIFPICHIALGLSHIVHIALYPIRVVADQCPRLNCKFIIFYESVEIP